MRELSDRGGRGRQDRGTAAGGGVTGRQVHQLGDVYGGGGRLPRRGKGPGLGLGLPGRITLSGGGTGQGDEATDCSTAGSSFVVK